MSRLTGNDAYGLMEAYASVYESNELLLTEEQFIEEVNYWVDSVIEEGYDLSPLSWDDVYLMAEDAVGRTGRGWGQQFGQALRGAAGGALSTAGNVLRGAGDVAGAALQGNIGQRTTSSNPLARAANLSTRVMTAPARGTIRFGQGAIEGLAGGGNRPARPSSTPTPSRFAGARDAAINKARQIQGSPVVGPRQPAAAPATRPSGGAPAPSTRPSGGAPAPSRPAATPSGTTTAQKPTPAATPAAPQKSFNPLMQRTFGYQTGNSPKEQQARADAIVKSGQVAALKPQPTPAAKPAPTSFARTRSQVLGQSFDPFDVVMGHLLDEGYADTEEAALAIMTSMSEEWRYSIIEAKKEPPNVRIRKQMKRKLGSDKPKDWEDVGYMSGTTGVPVPKH